MRTSSKLSVAAVSSIAAVSLAAGAGTAQASPFSPITTTSDTVSVSTQGAGATAAASCPTGKHVISGGFETSLTPTHGPATIASSTVGRDGWQSSVNEFAVGDDSLTAFANCARNATPERTSAASVTLGADQRSGSVTAVCPTNTEAIAGGFTTSYDGAVPAGNVVYESQRVGDDSWRVSAIHVGSAAVPLTAVVYCGHAAPLQATSAAVQVPNDAAGAVPASANCPAGTIAVSGGFSSSTADDGTFTMAAVPAASRLAGAQTWQASAISPGIGGPFDFTAYAYCASTR